MKKLLISVFLGLPIFTFALNSISAGFQVDSSQVTIDAHRTVDS